MDVTLAQNIIDRKGDEAAHIFLDTNDTPRDKHIENLFNDLFTGAPLDRLFRTNFTVYYQELIMDRDAPIAATIFIDAGTAAKWVADNLGAVSVRELTKRQRAELASDDSELANARYVARIKSLYAKKCPPAYAPSQLHAVLLVAVFVFRAEADKRLRKLLAPAYAG